MSTLGSNRARSAVTGGKLDMDDFLSMPILPGEPLNTGASLRAPSTLFLPVPGEIGDAKACLRLRLPAGIGSYWPDQFNPVLALAADQVRCGDRAHIAQLLFGKMRTLREGGLNRLSHGKIGVGSRSRLDIGNQMRQILIAAFRQRNVVASPGR
jgi:hypothetical protein